MKVNKAIIVQKIQVNASPIEVYDAFINPKIHSEFTGSKASGNMLEGSKFTAWNGYIYGTHLELKRGKKIIQEWVTSEWPINFPPSRLELTFNEIDNKTEITMIHSDIPSSQEADLRQGWIEFYWNPLKEFFLKEKKK